jgi:putative glutamine amidotransferase
LYGFERFGKRKESQMRPVVGITCSLTASGIGDSIYTLERNIIARDYSRAIEYAGGTPLLIPHVGDIECINQYLGVLDGLVLSGGGDIDPLLFGQEPHQNLGSVDRVRDEMELQLTQKALDQDLPILAICRGIQMLNVAAGGTIYQDIAAEMPQPTLRHSQSGAGWYASHTIDIISESRLFQIFDSPTARVNSFHHQAVREIGEGFIATAKAKDNVIEAIESPTRRFALGVQYHPEMMWEHHPEVLNLFTAFLKACQ